MHLTFVRLALPPEPGQAYSTSATWGLMVCLLHPMHERVTPHGIDCACSPPMGLSTSPHQLLVMLGRDPVSKKAAPRGQGNAGHNDNLVEAFNKLAEVAQGSGGKACSCVA